MSVPPEVTATAGPGVPTLISAARTVRECGNRYATLSPHHWRAPSARLYRQRMADLVAAVRAAASQLDVAVVAAQQHAAELEYVRQALLGGHEVPR